ncbi:MAG TPA: thiamine phosphate synthase [Burkholderiales bacterium]|nr:thiamine phosphate synthase [Burkholderiales bacterium]
MSNRIAGLYAIADTRTLDDSRLIPAVRAAIEGGARVIQYRDKSDDVDRRGRQASTLASLCREHGVVFLINDDIALAQQVDADGVHVGRDDAPLHRARTALGAQSIVGVSCYNELARAERAQTDGADYVAFGSFFASLTKPNAVRADLDLLKQARRTLHVSIVAIGGITPQNATPLVEAGADALAVIDGVFGVADPRAAAQRYRTLFR